jgi:NAD+ synthase
VNTLKITLAQVNPTVGDITANLGLITNHYRDAAGSGTDIIVFPELAVTGYPPEDLVLRASFIKAAIDATQQLVELTKSTATAIIFGNVNIENGKLYNSLVFAENGQSRIINKRKLPNYGVFDEIRLFTSGEFAKPLNFRGLNIAFLVCEDLWGKESCEFFAGHQIDLSIVINASPYEYQKRKNRTEVAENFVKATKSPLIYLNQIGGQDELVFDGNSFFMAASGEIIHNLPGFEQKIETLTFNLNSSDPLPNPPPNGEGISPYITSPLGRGFNLTLRNSRFAPFMESLDSVYAAMVLGLRDYVEKNRFKGVVISLSGGIDSALTAAVAVDALGGSRVRTVMLPHIYTSPESVADAAECARLLGVRHDVVSIENTVDAVNLALQPLFSGMSADTTEENIQARARAVIMMGISNKFGLMLVTTGNKSEMSVGYSTLYGDLCGGYSVLKDVYKTTVYKLSNWRNENKSTIGFGPGGVVIPQNIINKAPSAELKPNQKDQDTLPAYEILDEILEMMVEKQMGIEETVSAGFAREVVEKIAKMLYAAEYKRRQAPPGVKLTGMAFGRDRRYPITNNFRV